MAKDNEQVRYFDFKLNPNQESAVQKIKDFLKSDETVFILKGHAGTGKTTLVKGLLKLCQDDLNFHVNLMASTGRAAEVLSTKTKEDVSTVHGYIYNPPDRDKEQLKFGLKKNTDGKKTVYFVDESSMISSKKVIAQYLAFGSGSLLNDLLNFVGNRKIVFVGDEYQLPPVNSPYSPALSPEFLLKYYNLKADFIKLDKIERQSDSAKGISYNIEYMRSHLEQESFPYLSIKASGFQDISVLSNTHNFEMKFVSKYNSSKLNKAIILAFTNKKVNALNYAIRNRIFNRPGLLVPNDVLMVGQNNYKLKLTNGSLIKIIHIYDKKEKRAGLSFSKVKIKIKQKNKIFTTDSLLIDKYLTSYKPQLEREDEHRLYVDFIMRMKNINITPNSDNFINYLTNDEYLNALRARYGYAITCHKAQGGEWKNVFIYLEPAFFGILSKDIQFRWMYTAVSRASKKLYLLQNMCIY